MSWKMSGTYAGSCTCQLVCPCPVDGVPTGPGGECRNLNVFHIARGNHGATDISGVDFVFVAWFPANLTARFTSEPLPKPDGGVTTVKNATYGFSPEFLLGKGPGHVDLFGIDFDGICGETSDFTFASEMAEGAPKARV